MNSNPIDPQPSEIYIDAAGCEWTVIGVHTQPSVILEDARGFRVVPAIDSPLFRNMRAKASAAVVPERCERAIDAGILREVEVLQAAGVETFESCQGGAGHSYPEPTVCFHGQQSEGFRALGIALQNGLKATELRRYWTIEDREPVGPHWQLVFASPAHPDIRVEPTLSEVRKIWHDHFGARCSHPNADADIMGFALEVLSRFSPTVSPEPDADDLIEVGDRVRVKSGPYHGRIAKVTRLHPGGFIELRIHPGVDSIGFTAHSDDLSIYDKASWGTEPASLNTSTSNGLEQENASQPAGSVQQEPSGIAEDWLDAVLNWPIAPPSQTEITDEEISHLAFASGIASAGDCDHYRNRVKKFARQLLANHSPSISGETPTIESVRELVEQMPRGTIWKTQLAELVEYTKAAVVRFGVGR